MSIELQNDLAPTSPLVKRHSEDVEVEIVKRLVALAEMVAAQMTPQRIDLYLQYLGDIPPSILLATLERCPLELKFFPTVAEIREMAGLSEKEKREKAEAEENLKAELA